MTISIIVSFYNVAPFVADCLNSVLAQTTTDWECICVDDCSTDDTAALLDEYAAKDKRFKVTHLPQNLGNAARARNVGLGLITGDFVFFLDGDDVIHPQSLETLSGALEKTDAGLAYGGIVGFRGSVPIMEPFETTPIRIWHAPLLLNLWRKEKGFLRANVVTCLFRRSAIDGVTFNDALYHDEDYLFLQRVLAQLDEIVSVSVPVYFYRLHAHSLTGVGRPDIYISSVLARLTEDAEVLLPLVDDDPTLKCALVRKDTQDFYRRLIRKTVRKATSKEVAFAQLDLIRPAWVALAKMGIVNKKYLTPYQRGIVAWLNRGYYKILWRVLRLFG